MTCLTEYSASSHLMDHSMDAWIAVECGARGPDELLARLAKAQWAAARQTVRYAVEKSVFYARHLAGCDLNVRSAEDLARLPFTTAAQLIEQGGRDFLCVSQDAVQRMVSLRTSGTTGSPKRLAFSEHDLARTRAFFRVGMGQLLQPGDHMVVLLPGAERPDGVADLLRQALGSGRGLPVTVTALSEAESASAEGMASRLEALQPQCLVAAPAQLAALLRRYPANGLPCLPRLPRLRGILCSADYLDPQLSRAVREAWGCELLDHYGLTEAGYGCAVECPAHDGYHIREMDLLLECIDPRTGCPVSDTSAGELVLTTLNREAMPLIRYRTGDAASIIPGPCRCGSPLRRLGPVTGRIVQVNGRVEVIRPPKGGGQAAWQGSEAC